MRRTERSAAVVTTTPESAGSLSSELIASRREAAFFASALAAACRDPEASPAHLVHAADRARDAAARLRGAAALTQHPPTTPQ